MSVTKQQLQSVIENVEKGDYKIYFFVPDFQKHSGGVPWIYNHVRQLNQNGYNAIILHQKKGFKPDWLRDYIEVDDNDNFLDVNIQYLEEE